MVRDQSKRTPKGQWVRVIGGWSPYQFKERRMPTVAELNAASPDMPVFVLFLYSQAMMNKAGVAALQLTPQSVPPEGGRYEFVKGAAPFCMPLLVQPSFIPPSQSSRSYPPRINSTRRSTSTAS
jgi:predicted amidohydrolase YtcJ